MVFDGMLIKATEIIRTTKIVIWILAAEGPDALGRQFMLVTMGTKRQDHERCQERILEVGIRTISEYMFLIRFI